MPPCRGLRPVLAAATQATRTPVQLSRRELSVIATSPSHSSSYSTRLSHRPSQPLIAGGKRPAFQQQRVQRRHGSSSASETELKQTPLYDLHTSLGAKMVPFASYAMPLDYPDQSHRESHLWTRQHASLFDVSHMVQHKLSGPLAEEFLMTITPASIDAIEKHHSTLSCLLNDKGGIVDDTVISRVGKDSFYFVTNAGRRKEDLAFIQTQMDAFLESKNAKPDQIDWHVLNNHALVALQGPASQEVLQRLVFHDVEDESLNTDLGTLYFGTSRWLQLTLPDGMNTPSLLISRTGYTGEDGFEISIPPENGNAAKLATSIASALTADHDTVRWAGLGARDSLRLEAGMCLYGHDLDETITPPVAALGWLVGQARRGDDAKVKFNGHAVVSKQLASPKTMPERRVGFVIEKGPAAREGAEIVDVENGNAVVGRITSGCPSPSMDGVNIAMGYVKNGFHKKGTKLGVKVRKSVRTAEVAKMPFVESKFYREAKAAPAAG